jgi:hypothetical protein
LEAPVVDPFSTSRVVFTSHYTGDPRASFPEDL